MILYELLTEMTAEQLSATEQKVKDMFDKIGVVVHFTVHFRDRSTNGNIDDMGNPRGDLIVDKELIQAFKRTIDANKALFMTKPSPIKQGILRDIKTKLNIPFGIQVNPEDKKVHLYLITIKKSLSFRAGNLPTYQS
jgi:hypothetical protein